MDGLSCQRFGASASRFLLTAVGYSLPRSYRDTLAGTELETASIKTIRSRLIKIGARISPTVGGGGAASDHTDGVDESASSRHNYVKSTSRVCFALRTQGQVREKTEMERLDRFQSAASGLGVAIGVVLSKFTTNWLIERDLPLWMSVPLSLGIVVIAYAVFRTGSGMLVGHVRWLRRFLMGHRFIEGTWLNIVLQDELKNPDFVGMIRFEFEENALTVTGWDFELNGAPKGYFSAEMAVFDWPLLKYKYQWTELKGSRLGSEGFGEMQFLESNAPPTMYQGFFIDLTDGVRRNVWGLRIADKGKQAQLTDPKDLAKIVTDFVEQSKQLFREYLT